MGFAFRAAAIAAVVFSFSINGLTLAFGQSGSMQPSQNLLPNQSVSSKVPLSPADNRGDRLSPQQRIWCQEILQQIEAKASQVFSYYVLYNETQGERSKLKTRLADELERPWILYNKERIAQLRLEIAQKTQLIEKYRVRHNQLADELELLEEDFFKGECGELFGYSAWWREERGWYRMWDRKIEPK
jgi:hypothetical protein